MTAKVKLLSIALTLTVLTLNLGCEKKETTSIPAEADPSTVPAVQAAKTSYVVKGVVTEVRTAQNMVKVKHEEIPGYMMAMTMPFQVKDTNILAKLKVGDAIEFRLRVTPDDSWMEELISVSNQ